MSGEKEEDYTWTLNCYLELLQEHLIPPLALFVTDRELALLKTIDALFPLADHILCR